MGRAAGPRLSNHERDREKERPRSRRAEELYGARAPDPRPGTVLLRGGSGLPAGGAYTKVRLKYINMYINHGAYSKE